jgi:paraquat-inducible protein A
MTHRLLRLRTASLANATALAIAAAVMLVPANLLPVLTMDSPGRNRTDTIYSGIMGLWQEGLWPIALIVFTASMLIPALKLAGLAWLLFLARRGRGRHARQGTRLYAALDFIGRWSMLDVFLVAFLTGLVQFGALATVLPQPGIAAFALAVILTVLATQAFDPRILWRHVASETSATVLP